MISLRIRCASRKLLSVPALVFAAFAVSAVSGCSQQKPSESETPDLGPPNVLLISVDTLRPDHLGAYGYAKNTSPRIDALAAGGVTFENAISSSSWTLPAHAALFTGLSDSVHGCDDSHRRLDESRVTLAEHFGELGYETVGFFAGPFLHPTFGLAQGFERYIDCSSYAEESRRVAQNSGNLDTPDIVSASHVDVTNPRVAAQVKQWLAIHRGGSKASEPQAPLFMFIHLWDVHFDFVPPPPYDTMFDPDYEGTLTGEDFFRNPAVNPRMSRADLDHILALYDGEIAWTDYHIGLILDDLAERGLMENTIVALVSDHGEEFFEHQGKGHRFTLYDEVIRIPMILWYPKKIPAGTRVEKTTSIVDIFPTLLELSGAAPSAQPMGRSLVPLINHDPRSADKLAISELNTLGQDIATFRSVDRKMRVDNATGNAWSYDLRIDPRERLGQLMRGPVSDWERDMLAETKQLRGWLRERKQRFPKASVAPQLSDALVEQLKLLGYLEEETPETSSRE